MYTVRKLCYINTIYFKNMLIITIYITNNKDTRRKNNITKDCGKKIITKLSLFIKL